ncbi:S41 family peptidase [Bacillus sp. FJAT-50079]|uniref:S41 family peptidase n=1 Tax=Bacillus sp. FJAT-50079 TaxID=2833577 RepID=UPI001BC8D79B|nr:S41 family peptidase [Bacillus sp. FJAT-50079]MBS4208365.1 S41 family peptidase [Bacillus sp. FJAT-50079]
MKKKWLAVISICSLLLGAGGTYAGMTWLVPYWQTTAKESPQESSGLSIGAELDKVAQAYELIRNAYVNEVDEKQLIQGAIQGMIGTLKDPYSVYMDADTAESFEDSLDSSFDGIGAHIAIEEGKLIIVSPIKNAPAEKAGLKAKDQIIKIDGENVEGLDINEASLKIRGEKGSVVKLEVVRRGLAEPITFSVTRDEVPILTVFSDVKQEKGGKIGYIEITSFAKGTARDFKTELQKLEEQQIAGLIIDVRGNPGGMLISVEEILGELVTGKKPIVQIEERNGNKKPYYSGLKKRKPYPISVLIDEGSASASEILASALEEIEGYALIGEKTFGKGTVQQPIPLDDGSNIKLTVFKWLTPDGNWIHGKGIEPTTEVKQPSYFYTQSLPIEETLSKDMNNEKVKIAQEMLKGLGYGPGRTDGYFDEQTERAVKAFQTIEKIDVTGELTVDVAQKLEESVIRAIQDEKNDIQLQVALKTILK